MIKRYVLYKKDNEHLAVSYIDWDTNCNSLDCYDIFAWIENKSTGKFTIPDAKTFVAHAYLKFDSCTHWWFPGEDYDPTTKEEADSYYHICGADSLLSMMTRMAFIWEVGARNHAEGRKVFYDESEELNEIIKLLLSDYEIVEEELEEKEND